MKEQLRCFEWSQQAGEAEEGMRQDGQPGRSPAPRIALFTKGTKEPGWQFPGAKSEHIRFTPLSMSISKWCLTVSYALNIYMTTDDLEFIYMHEGVLIRVFLWFRTQI